MISNWYLSLKGIKFITALLSWSRFIWQTVPACVERLNHSSPSAQIRGLVLVVTKKYCNRSIREQMDAVKFRRAHRIHELAHWSSAYCKLPANAKQLNRNSFPSASSSRFTYAIGPNSIAFLPSKSSSSAI